MRMSSAIRDPGGSMAMVWPTSVAQGSASAPAGRYPRATKRRHDDRALPRARRLTIEPWLAFLAQRQDSWVFQNQTVQKIVEEVFADYMVGPAEFIQAR